MTVNEILSALAHKLGELFPERAVYYTQIPREAERTPGTASVRMRTPLGRTIFSYMH